VHMLTMEIRIYRERPTASRPAKPAAEALWAHLITSLESIAPQPASKGVPS